jgi:hypothetical protein
VVVYRRFTSNSVYLRSEHRVMARFIARVQLAYAHRAYEVARGGSAVAGDRTEHFIESRAQLAVPLRERLGVGLTLLVQRNVASPGEASAFGGGLDPSYGRFFLLLSVSAVR